jgi:hypothetical protein
VLDFDTVGAANETEVDNPEATVEDISEMNMQSIDYELKKANSKAFYSIVSIVTILLIGSFVMSAIESWTFVDSVYWAIVTITTVGFGDIAPKSTAGRSFCIVYILLGSLIVARAMSVFIQYPMITRRKRMEMKVLKQFKQLPAQTVAALNGSFQRGAYNFLRPKGQSESKEIQKAEFIVVLLEMMDKLSPQDVLMASRVFDSLDVTSSG